MSLISSTGTIITEVSNRVNVDSSENEDLIVTDINQCTRDVSLSFPDGPFLKTSALQTLSGGTSEYTVPSDSEKIVTIRDITNKRKLTFLPVEQFDIVRQDQSVSGTPRLYTLLNDDSIKFAPIPSTAIDIEYRYDMALATVSAVSSTPPLPTKYNELYVLFSESKALIRQGRRQDSKDVRVEYEGLKNQMIADLRNQTEELRSLLGIRDIQKSNNDFGNDVVNIFWNT